MGEVNDRKPHGANVDIEDKTTLGIGATVGAGIDYFVTRNVAIGLEAKYLYTRGLTLQVAGGPSTTSTCPRSSSRWVFASS